MILQCSGMVKMEYYNICTLSRLMVQKKQKLEDQLKRLVLASASESCIKCLNYAIELEELTQIKQSVYLLANIYNQMGEKFDRNKYSLISLNLSRVEDFLISKNYRLSVLKDTQVNINLNLMVDNMIKALFKSNSSNSQQNIKK